MIVSSSNVLNYDVEEDNHMNFEKLEKDYQRKVLNKYRIFNINCAIIKAKKEEHEDLLFEIQNHLESNLRLEDEGRLTEHYSKIIGEYELEIKIKEHLLECYRNMFSRLYKNHFLISRRYDDEISHDGIRYHHLEKYKNIQMNAIKIIKSKKSMLSKITALYDMESVNQSTELEKKNRVAIHIKARVNLLLNQITNEELELNTIKIKQDRLIRKIKDQQRLNTKLAKEYRISNKDFCKIKLLLLNMFKEMQTANLEKMINNYNSKRFIEYKLLTSFKILNKYIRDNSTEYYKLTQELKTILDSIAFKKKHESMLNERIEKAKNELRYLYSYKSIQKESVTKRQDIFNAITHFLVKYYHSIYKITHKRKISIKPLKTLDFDMKKWLNFFNRFSENLYKVNSLTLNRVIEGYFFFNDNFKCVKFECISYSKEEFISGYKFYYQKISEQYHNMVAILNQSIKNHNEDKSNCVELPLFNPFQMVRRKYKKRTNIIELTSKTPKNQLEELKIAYDPDENSTAFPELSLNKEDDEESYKDKIVIQTVKKKRNMSFDSFGHEKELYIQRTNDIRRLELHYFNLKEKSPIKTENINEFYHKLKKRFKKHKCTRITHKTNVNKIFLTEQNYPKLTFTNNLKTEPKVVRVIFHRPKDRMARNFTQYTCRLNSKSQDYR